MVGPVLPPSDTGVCGARPLRQQMAGVSLSAGRYPVAALDTLGSPGEVSERPKERDWKSRKRRKAFRGFKSRPLRWVRSQKRSETAQNLGSTEKKSRSGGSSLFPKRFGGGSTTVPLAAAVEGIDDADSSFARAGRPVVADVGELVPLPLDRVAASRRRRFLPTDVVSAALPADADEGYNREPYDQRGGYERPATQKRQRALLIESTRRRRRRRRGSAARRGCRRTTASPRSRS